jgi:hypothetical protein
MMATVVLASTVKIMGQVLSFCPVTFPRVSRRGKVRAGEEEGGRGVPVNRT